MTRILALLPIQFYRWVISPVIVFLAGSVCRYRPSCSAYAIEAVRVHGIFRGYGLALRRLGRCHPWGGSGYDPVPPRGTDLTHADPHMLCTLPVSRPTNGPAR